MSNVLKFRQNLNLTQEELSEKSGISIRTIQRIEAGTLPKGHTLKALAKALGISENDLLDTPKVVDVNTKWLKVINFSSLLFVIVPPLNFLAPLIIMLIKKQFNPITKTILSIQLVWTLMALCLLILILILKDWFDVQSKITSSIAILWMLINGIIILRNASAINNSRNPHLLPNIHIM